MITKSDVYISYIISRAKFFNRGYRLPKDIDNHITKMVDKNKDNINYLELWFNTKWNSIDVNRYFDIGFELFGKGFSYHKFLDKKILAQYIVKDKLIKHNRDDQLSKFQKSVNYVKGITDKSKISQIKLYCMGITARTKRPIYDYTYNHIDALFLTYIIYVKYFHIDNIEFGALPYVTSHWNENIIFIQENIDEIKKIAKEIE
jgi:hypothetical protein